MNVLGGEVNITPGPTNPDDGTKPEHSAMEVTLHGYVPQTNTQAAVGVPAVTNRESIGQTRTALVQQFNNTPLSALVEQCRDMKIDCSGIALADIAEYMAMVLLDPDMKAELAKPGDKPLETSAELSVESETP